MLSSIHSEAQNTQKFEFLRAEVILTVLSNICQVREDVVFFILANASDIGAFIKQNTIFLLSNSEVTEPLISLLNICIEKQSSCSKDNKDHSPEFAGNLKLFVFFCIKYITMDVRDFEQSNSNLEQSLELISNTLSSDVYNQFWLEFSRRSADFDLLKKKLIQVLYNKRLAVLSNTIFKISINTSGNRIITLQSLVKST